MRDDLESAVVDFRRRLVKRSIPAGPARSVTAVTALRALEEPSREQMYWALRASLLSRPEDIPGFDSEFVLFWEDAEPLLNPEAPGDQPSLPARDARPDPDGDQSAEATSSQLQPTPREAELAPAEEEDGGVVASEVERLLRADFSTYSASDLHAARRLMWQLARRLPRRRTRRLGSSRTRGRALDLRRTLRAGMRTDTELLRRNWLTAQTATRSLVLLVDVSGSMEGYAVPLLSFCQAAIRHVHSAETFTFGTRLTRITPHLRRGSAEAAFQRATRAVPDWAGGTRIGDSLHTFNRMWGQRGMTAGAIVIIASDGWERGDPHLLEREVARLHRAAHTLIWINPVAGDPGYQPLVRGLAAALPHVDGFQPANNLHSLEELVARLARIE